VFRVCTREQLLRELGSDAALRVAVAAGPWQRVVRGAYVLEGDPDDLQVRALAAQLVLPGHVVVAGCSALWLCGVDVLPPYAMGLEVLVPRGAVVPRRNGLEAREGLLRPGDVGRVGQVRTLSPQRAALDLLRRLPLAEAVPVADAVQHAGLRTRAELEAELRRHARLRGVRGAARAIELSDGRAESLPESRLRVELVLAGLVPVPQHEVRLPSGGLVARVDLAFPEHRLALEYDGREVHGGRDAFVADRQRQNALVAQGWTVLRFTAVDLRQVPALVALVRAALAAAAA